MVERFVKASVNHGAPSGVEADTGKQAVATIERIRASEAFIDATENPEGQNPNWHENLTEECEDDKEVAEATKAVLNPENEDVGQTPACRNTCKTTLRAVLAGRENLDSCLSGLWHLLCYLRIGDDQDQGCDLAIVPRPFSSRKLVWQKPQKWQNVAQSALARLDAFHKEPASRQSRIQSWIEHTEQCRKRIAPALPSMLQIHRGYVVVIRHGLDFDVCIVISVWRRLVGRSGNSQLVTVPLPLGSLSALRVVRGFAARKGVECGYFMKCSSISSLSGS